MFPGSTGTPIELNNVLNRVILPALKKATIPWFGYHAFRRGLATNLHDAGVNDLTIQRILRHSDVSVTRRAYIKRLPQQATDAMEKDSERDGEGGCGGFALLHFDSRIFGQLVPQLFPNNSVMLCI
jgi:integrase